MKTKTVSIVLLMSLFLVASPVSAGLVLTMTLSYNASPQYLVNALAVYDDKLYAGTGLYAGQGEIYAYDGATWILSHTVDENQVWVLAEYGGKLYAGTGAKYVAVPSPHTEPGGEIYVYDGTSWSVSYDTPESHVIGFGVYGGKLYAGTSPLGRIYAYDGTSWSIAHSVSQPHVRCFAEYGGKLYVGTEYPAAIYVYDGTSWSLAWSSSDYSVYSLAVFDGKLYAGTGNHAPTRGAVYVFDGTSWSTAFDTDTNEGMWSLAVYRGVLFAGTWLPGVIYAFDGTDWELACDWGQSEVLSLAGYEDKLYAGTTGRIYVSQILPPPVIPVYVDIKPGSWPNPINVGSKGVIPVTICGTSDFDVMTIDPATVKLSIEGGTLPPVAPVRWLYYDSATPWTGEPGGGHALGGDGYLDLVLYFNTQAVVGMTLTSHAGEHIPLKITGNLDPAFDGTPIVGQDYVWILKK